MKNRIDIRNARGQAMVEFVMIVPVLLVVLFGIIQFGIAFKNYVTLTDAVRAGARVAAVSRLATDPVGDTTNKVLTVYQVKGGAWVPVKTDTFK